MGVLKAHADLEVSAAISINATADFHVPLEPHGVWIEVGSHGRCWRPAGIAVGWRPYCYGRWVWTDCGWYWESSEPWAWACYHYGYWVHDSHHGWLWIPGVEWAPAWVSWRVGGGYVGWAPLAPRHVSGVSVNFVFVKKNRFHERLSPSTVIVNNTTIINQTTVVGGIKHETRTIGNAGKQRVVVNEGPDVAEIQQAAGKKIERVSVTEAAARTPVPAELKRGRDKSTGNDAAAPAEKTSRKDNAVPTAPDKPSRPDLGKPDQKQGVPPPQREGGPGQQPGKPKGTEGEKGKTPKDGADGIAPPPAQKSPDRGAGPQPEKPKGKKDQEEKGRKPGKEKK